MAAPVSHSVTSSYMIIIHSVTSSAPVPDASGGEPAGFMYLGVSLDTILEVSGAVCRLGAHDDDLGAVARIRPPVSQRANTRADNR